MVHVCILSLSPREERAGGESRREGSLSSNKKSSSPQPSPPSFVGKRGRRCDTANRDISQRGAGKGWNRLPACSGRQPADRKGNDTLSKGRCSLGESAPPPFRRAGSPAARASCPCHPFAYTILCPFLLFLKNISCGECRKLLHIGVSCGQQQGDEFASILGQQVPMRSLDFSDEPVRA